MAFQEGSDTLKALQPAATADEASAESDLDQWHCFCHSIEHRKVPCQAKMERRESEKEMASALKKAELTVVVTFEVLKAKTLSD